MEEKDNINPSHYTDMASIECFDLIVQTQGVEDAKAFCRCNAIKYLFRNKAKNGDEDVIKASWYLSKYKELVELEKSQE